MADRELDRFTHAPVVEGRRVRARLHPVRVVLSIAVVLVVGLVLWPTTDELLFHFRVARAVDIGTATELPPDKPLPLETAVVVHAVLGNRAAEIPVFRTGSLRLGPIEVREVLGAPLFIEYTRREHPTWGPFVEIDAEGRVVDLDSAELEPVKQLIRSQGFEPAPHSRVIIADERLGTTQRYLTAWIAGTALLVWTALSAVRAARKVVVERA